MGQRIAVIGSGPHGLVVAACLASIGHDVVGVTVDPVDRGELLPRTSRLEEPRLQALVLAGMASGALRLTDDTTGAVGGSDVVFVHSGGPHLTTGSNERNATRDFARLLLGRLRPDQVMMIDDSLAPVRAQAKGVLAPAPGQLGPDLPDRVVVYPMTLRANHAVDDFLAPQRIVLGSDDPDALDIGTAVFSPLCDEPPTPAGSERPATPLIRTTLATAEVISHANRALAEARLGVADEIAGLCERTGADVAVVAEATGLHGVWGRTVPTMDGFGRKRSGGGRGRGPRSALPMHRPSVTDGWLSVHESQREYILAQMLLHMKTFRGVKICILGSSFDSKAERADHPPIPAPVTRPAGQRRSTIYDPSITAVSDVADIRLLPEAVRAAADADAVVLATQWPQFLSSDLMALRRVMRGDHFFDGRNNFEPELVRRAGFRYVGIGRVSSRPAAMVLRSDALRATDSARMG